MAEVNVLMIENGPLKITGGVVFVDAASGDAVPGGDAATIFLCRCGGSSNKPFCDGTHKRNGFDGSSPAPEPADA